MSENFIEMELREIQTSDDPRDHPIIVLAEKNGEREFPIYIGPVEAKALEDVVLGEPRLAEHLRRPMTHDLVLNCIDGLGSAIVRVLVTKLEKSTFIGAIELRSTNGTVVRVDSRPSDAMILAMKRNSPVFVEEQVLRDVQRGIENP
ncbi:MAG: bifunctional nuclease family protein [Candidatus Sumerlaeaceae bacterium]